MHSSHETADPRLVAALTAEAPDAIARLERFGVAFTHEPTAATGSRAAAAPRASGCCRSATAPGTRSRPRCAAPSRPTTRIETLDHAPLLALDAAPSGWRATLGQRDGGSLAVAAGAIVLAAGGRCFAEAKRLGTFSTNAAGATGEVTEIALAAGCEARDLDALQYHPNGGLWPVTMQGYSIPETTRAYGALLLNARGERFVDELGGRDVVAAAIVRECEEGRGLTTPEGRPVGAARLPPDRRRGRRDLAAVHAAALPRGRHRSARRADPHLSRAALPERRPRDRRARRHDRRAASTPRARSPAACTAATA